MISLYRCIEVDIMGPEEVDGFIYPLSDLFVTIESGSGRPPPRIPRWGGKQRGGSISDFYSVSAVLCVITRGAKAGPARVRGSEAGVGADRPRAGPGPERMRFRL